MKSALLLCLSLCLLWSCGETTPEEQLEKDIEKIKDYLSEKNLTATQTASGLHYIINTPGSGGSPTINSKVTVKYTGMLLDGTVFDQTGSQNATFPLANLIQGWQEGIPLLQKGGKGTFLIPSALGYGNEDVGDIPACSVLVFDIELVNFQ
jgi:FKBP-type peptidyl-prolyl cis-trans isomerase FkpA